MEQAQASYRKHVRSYIVVFSVLLALTVITVTVSYLNLPTLAAIILAIAIASVKAGLVLAFFMHLISEKQIIIVLLVLMAIFFVMLMLVPVIASV